MHVQLRVQSTSLLRAILQEKNNPPACVCVLCCVCLLHMCILSHLQDTWFITVEPTGSGALSRAVAMEARPENSRSPFSIVFKCWDVDSSSAPSFAQPVWPSWGFFKFTHRVFIYANLLTPPAPIELATLSKGLAWPWTSDWICLCRFSAQFCFIYGASAPAQPPSGGWVEAHLSGSLTWCVTASPAGCGAACVLTAAHHTCAGLRLPDSSPVCTSATFAL